MLHQVIVRNYDEESRNQRAIYGQCMFRVISGRSVPGWKKYGTGIIVSSLHDCNLNLKDIVFPMILNKIKKFENLNDISVNVYCIEKQKELSILSIRLTDTKREKHVNLLYVQDDNEGHFAWIKNLSRLVSSQLSKKKNEKFFCDRYVYIY